MRTLHAVHRRPKIVIAGGGVAGLEALLALRALLGGTAQIELIAPETEFAYRPIAVAEPFGLGEVRRLELAQIAADQSAHLRQASLSGVDVASSIARTEQGDELPYDALVVAIGARQRPALDGAVTFGGSADRERLEQLMVDVEDGHVRRLVFAAPAELGWSLPLYELALFTASWAHQREISGLALTIVTSEPRPLDAFGATASDAVSALLAESSVRLLTDRRVKQFDAGKLSFRQGRAISADAVISLPALSGPALDGLPHDADGFIPTDRHGAVRGAPGVYAAGDGTTFPIKQGGLAAQQADAVAASIAHGLGAIEHAALFTPVLRGMLLTGAEPRYLRASAGADGVSEVSFAPLWWPPGKLAGRHLTPYLAEPGDLAVARSPLADRPADDATDAGEQMRADEQEAVDLLLEMADANARRGSFDFAVMCIEAAEDVGGPLPTARQADRRAWSLQQAR